MEARVPSRAASSFGDSSSASQLIHHPTATFHGLHPAMQFLGRYVLGRVAQYSTSALRLHYGKAAVVPSCPASNGARRLLYVPTRSFSSSDKVRRKQDQQESHAGTIADGVVEPEKSTNPEKRKKSVRASAGKDSLRRVAVEAERSRAGLFKRRGRRRFLDPDVERKVRTLCTYGGMGSS